MAFPYIVSSTRKKRMMIERCILLIISILVPAISLGLGIALYGHTENSFISIIIDRSDNMIKHIYLEGEEVNNLANPAFTGYILQTCSFENYSNTNTIPLMNLKKCEDTLHDIHFLARVANSHATSVIIIDNVNKASRLSSPHYLLNWWLPHSEKTNIPVIIVKTTDDIWEELEINIHHEIASISIEKSNKNHNNINISCPPLDDINIGDKDLGVFLSEDGNFLRKVEIIEYTNYMILNETRTINVMCDQRKEITSITFYTNSQKALMNDILIGNSTHESFKTSSCCLTKTNLLSSFGTDCPKFSKELVDKREHCNFTSYLSYPCNKIIQQKRQARFCLLPSISCVLQEYYQKSCALYDEKVGVCNLENMSCY